MQAVFTVYRVKWMANPHPREPLESLYSPGLPGVLLGGCGGGGRGWGLLGCPSILILFPRRAAVPAHCTGTQAGGGSRSLGRGQGCLSYTWQKDSEARISRQNKPSQTGQPFKTVCPTCRTHSDSRQFPGVNGPRKRAKKVNREKDWGQNMPPNKPGAKLHCRLGPRPVPQSSNRVLLRAFTPTPITRGLRCQALEFLTL